MAEHVTREELNALLGKIADLLQYNDVSAAIRKAIAPQPKQHSGWVNIVDSGDPDRFKLVWHPTRESANDARFRIACIKVEFTEGEGLDG